MKRTEILHIIKSWILLSYTVGISTILYHRMKQREQLKIRNEWNRKWLVQIIWCIGKLKIKFQTRRTQVMRNVKIT